MSKFFIERPILANVIAIVTIVQSVGTSLSGTFTTVNTGLK